MAGIYFHIPFCKQKCHYCNFYSVASLRYRDVFIAALLKEIEHRKNYLHNALVQTIYFGGGTPSMLTTNEINDILQKTRETFNVANDVEITLEANPDDLNEEKLKSLKNETAVNRFSIGIQSFFNDDLKYLNRVHSADQAISSIELALQHGFQNLTIDLIYGIPTLTDEKWRQNLMRFFSFDLPHLSSYSLTVEPKTALNVLIKKGKIQGIDDEQSIRHFEILIEETNRKGYIHYEISNFAKKGFYSKHNSLYWLGGHYVGIGPSAHSFNGSSRQWNVSNMKQYIETEKLEKLTTEKEVLSTDQLYNEYVMTSLRTSWGCDSTHIKNVFGDGVVAGFLDSINTFLEEKKVFQTDGRFFLTNKGKLFADGIAAALFR